MRGSWTRWAAVAVGFVALAGCGSGTADQGGLSVAATGQPGHWAAATCPSPTAPRPSGPVAQAGGIPAGFRVAWVLRCETRVEMLPGRGQWQVQVAERADTSAGDLIARLNRPGVASTTPSMPCALIAVTISYVALVDAHGRAWAPAVPTGPCGQPSPGVTAALRALRFRTVSITPISQLQSQGALDAGCAQQWKDQLAIEGMPIRAGQQNGLWSTPPTTIRVCEYQRHGGTAAIPVGDFLSGHVITGGAATGLARELAQTAPAASCTAGNTRFAVLFGQKSSAVFVELDGCRRMQGPTGAVSRVPPSVVGEITAKR